MTNGPVQAATELIKYAKLAGDDAVTAATAIELSCTGLDADELRSVLRLAFCFLAELYEVKRLSKLAMDARTEQTFNELAAMLSDIDTSGDGTQDQ